MNASLLPESVSPELALVDAELAEQLRSALDERSPAARGVEPSAARQRLIELSDVTPPRRSRRLGVAKLGLAFATWGTAALMVVDTRLYGM